MGRKSNYINDIYSMYEKEVEKNKNQSKNAGKTLDATILLSKEDYEEYEPTFVNTMNVAKSSSSITTSINITEGSNDIDKYYFKAEEVED